MTEAGTMAIGGIGMACSLGLDAGTACAAARAGILRAQRLDYFKVRSPKADEMEEIAAHPAPRITMGFEDSARLTILLAAGLRDLSASAAEIGPAVSCYLSAPSPLRPLTGSALLDPAKDRKVQAREGGEPELEPIPAEDARTMLSNACNLAGWPGELDLRFISGSGHTGVAEALRHAMADLRAGVVSGAIVGGVDSLLDEATLGWLHSLGRLKTFSQPTGLQPGEACALTYLERPQPRRPAIAAISDAWTASEPGYLLSGKPPRGTGLSEVLFPAAARANLQNADLAWLITDQNGEYYRALEWGNAVPRLIARFPAVSRASLWNPAASLGDTGAASGAVAVCIAVRAFARNYAPYPAALVTSSSDGPFRAALMISAPVERGA
jgi:3-oxoacyl-[acyl-carrier-protein] synthase-1